MKKLILSSLALMLILTLSIRNINYLYAQGCVINGFANPSTVTCGYCTELSAFGYSLGDIVFENNFNDSTAGTGWETSPAATFTNPCGPGPDGRVSHPQDQPLL